MMRVNRRVVVWIIVVAMVAAAIVPLVYGLIG
jgi:hypothetical protein